LIVDNFYKKIIKEILELLDMMAYEDPVGLSEAFIFCICFVCMISLVLSRGAPIVFTALRVAP
jgi:hypothetical protein